MNNKKILFGLLSCLFAANVFAAPMAAQTCEGASCFNSANQTTVDPTLLQKAPKVAWLTPSGHGWMFGGGNKGSAGGGHYSDGGSSWFMKVPSKGPINPRGTFVFYPGKSTFAAYDSEGNLVTSGRASGGMDYCPDSGHGCHTPVGTFKVRSLGSADCISHIYPIETGGGAPMPYCMFFTNDFAVHGSDYVPGHPASHGCIRLTPSTAEWIRDNFMQIGTVVKVNPY